MAKSKNLVRPKNPDFSPNFKNINIGLGFLIPKTRLVFTKLKQVFIETLIYYYFYSKYYIRIEINIFEYVISKTLS